MDNFVDHRGRLRILQDALYHTLFLRERQVIFEEK